MYVHYYTQRTYVLRDKLQIKEDVIEIIRATNIKPINIIFARTAYLHDRPYYDIFSKYKRNVCWYVHSTILLVFFL